MNIVDANVLLHSANSAAPLHGSARSWMVAALDRDETIGLAWNVLLAFMRISTRAGIFESPLTVAEATSAIAAWLAQPTAVVVEPGVRHLDVLGGLLDRVGTGGNLVSDAHLAALAVEHNATVVSFDRDFERFGVRWIQPD